MTNKYSTLRHICKLSHKSDVSSVPTLTAIDRLMHATEMNQQVN